MSKKTIVAFIFSASIIFSPAVFSEDATITRGKKEAAITPEKEEKTVALEKENLLQKQIEWLQAESAPDVSISTRHQTPIEKAPGIVTVITAGEIKNAGYRNFVEILRPVPGFELLKNGGNGTEVCAMRGIQSSNKVRLMVNGHMVNDPFTGNPFSHFDDFPVDNIKRIEVIRGPGSALYGENAFTAVINIITFDAKDVDGVRVSGGYGSFDTEDESVVFGKTYGGVDVSGMVRYKHSDGFDGAIQSDLVTQMDKGVAPFGLPSASRAPGAVQDWRQEYDMNLKTVYKDFYVEGLYINKNQGLFTSPQYALTDESDWEYNYVFGEFGYKKTFEEKLTVKPRLYYDQFDTKLDTEALPDGVHLPLDTNRDGKIDRVYTYPDGFIGIGNIQEKIAGTEIPVDYELFDGNIATIGFEYRLVNQTNPRFSSNFHPLTLAPLGEMQSQTDTYNYQQDATRRILSFYLQDTWDISDTLSLTMGVRHDGYSDFGTAISPRTGVTWKFMENAALKVLYGSAFRPPSFVEMYTTNQPAILGNTGLDPEVIKTYEIGLHYRFNKHVTSSVNYFYNDITDLIVLRGVPDKSGTSSYQNYGDAHVQGVEMETKVDICKNNYVFMNYSFQNPEDNHGDDLPFVTQHKGNFGINAQYWKYVNTNLSTFVSGTRSREISDSRDDLPAYALLNLSVIGKEFFKTMEIQGSVYNLLDKDYSDPAPASIPGDFPRPGRTFWVGLKYQF